MTEDRKLCLMLCNGNIRTQEFSQKYMTEHFFGTYLFSPCEILCKPFVSDIIDDRQWIFLGDIGN